MTRAKKGEEAHLAQHNLHRLRLAIGFDQRSSDVSLHAVAAALFMRALLMPPALALGGVASGHPHRTDERATFAAALAAGLLAVAESEYRRIEVGS